MSDPNDPPRSMSDVTPVPDDHRTFAMLMAGLEDGHFNSDMTDKLKDLVAALSDAAAARGGKPKGAMTITLGFSLEDNLIDIRTKVVVTKPKEERRKTVMWVTPGNNLTGKNPRQHDLPFRVVDSSGPARTIRDEVPQVRTL